MLLSRNGGAAPQTFLRGTGATLAPKLASRRAQLAVEPGPGAAAPLGPAARLH